MPFPAFSFSALERGCPSHFLYVFKRGKEISPNSKEGYRILFAGLMGISATIAVGSERTVNAAKDITPV